MTTPMFGVESEYAVAGIHGKKPMQRDDLVNQLVRAAKRQFAYLPDTGSSSGMFLQNGARFYVDCGLHPEMATPECTTPWELATYIKAGERILEGVTQEVQAHAGDTAEVMCFRCNVDYSGSGSTWGCHESYHHRANPSSLPGQLISHLVTRVIYTGAGGFNPLSEGLEFCVAPRLMHIQQVVSAESTGNRGIFHTKNEPLAGDGNNRLHILCGESLCSETAIVLKIGATALVTAMAEAGLKPGAEMQLASPLEALHAVASDITCKQKLALAGGGEASAIDIQRRLVQLAERHQNVLPSWAAAICELWRRTLDQLEGAPDSVATILDWAIKRRLFHDRAERFGLSTERLSFFNSIIRQLNLALNGAGLNDRSIRLGVLLGPKSPIPGEVARLGGVLNSESLGWDDIERFLNLRDEFFQIDTRFGQIGPRGIFTQLDRGGVLNHKVAAVDGVPGGVEAAMVNPPAVGRARLRGETIRRLSGKARARCNWTAVFDPGGSALDLRDPFAAAEVWSRPAAPPPDLEQLAFEEALQDPSVETSADPTAETSVDAAADAGRLRQMIDAIRGRRGRNQTRDESAF